MIKETLHKLLTKLILISGMMLFATGITQAQWYLGAGAGQTSMEIQSGDWNYSDTQQTYAVDFNDKSYKIFGGWRATPLLTVEFGYADLGKYTEDYSESGYNQSAETKVTAYFAELVGNVELGGGWKFLGKLGAAYWDAEVEFNNSVPYSSSGSNNGFDPVLGLGFEFSHKFGASRMGVRLEWEQYQNTGEGVMFQISPQRSVTFNGTDINSFGLAAIFEF